MGQKKTWGEIRRLYPDTFVLLDQCEERRENDTTIVVTRGEVIFSSTDGKTIYAEYCKRGQPLHMTFGHTRWDTLKMEEVPFLGIRPNHD